MNELSTMTEAEHREYHVRKESVKQGITGVAEDLKYIRDKRLYREEYESFEAFVTQEFDKTRRWAYQQIGHVEVLQNVKSISHPPTLSQSVELGTLPDEEQADAYAESVEKAQSEGRETPTTKDVKETVQKRKAANGGEYKPPKKPKLVGPDPKLFHTHIGEAMRFLDRYYGHHNMKDADEVEEIRDLLGDAAMKHGELVKELA